MATLIGCVKTRVEVENRTLARDYIIRAEHRLAAVNLLFERKSWPDVVREAQEVVELALKALLRSSGIEVPRLHDVSGILREEKSKLPKVISKHLAELAEISKTLRRDRELAFYGSEDLTPSEFYEKSDAAQALKMATFVVDNVKPVIMGT